MPLPIDRIFEWFDHHAWGHWLIAWSAFALLIAAVLAPLTSIPAKDDSPAPDRRPWWLRLLGSQTLFSAAVLLVFCAFRWPEWFAGQLDNPDEAQWMAGAITLKEGGLPWKHLDLHTSGPLNAYTLLLAAPLGLPLNYIGARAFTALLQALSVLFVWRAARRFAPEWAARLAILPAVNLWACRWFHDMVQYCSEQAPILYLALAGWAAAVALTTTRPRARVWLLGVSGFLTSASLLAKPQALPVAAALGLLQLGAVWLMPTPEGVAPANRPDRWRRTLVLVAGALAPLVVLGLYLWIYGLFAQFEVFFIHSNRLYAGDRTYPVIDSPEVFFDLIDPIRGSTWSVLGALGFGSLVAIPALSADRTNRGKLLGAWLLVAAAFVAIVSPGRMFRHYVHFLVLPLSWLTALSLVGAHRHFNATANAFLPRRLLAALVGGFLLLSTAWPVWQTAEQCRPMNGQLHFWRQRQSCTVSEHIRRLASPGDKLVVWGWAPKYHAETGLAQGAREAHFERALCPGPMQSYHRDRLLFDLRRNRPRWFVDAVAPRQFGFQERSLFGHESWPPLRDYIAENYEQVDEADQVRIYRRKD